MKRTTIAAALAAMLPACGLSFNDILEGIAAADPVPLRLRSLCSPIFRDVDLRAIVIEINTAEDAGTTKTAAIAAAQQTCTDSAAALLNAQADEENSAFDAQAALEFEVECVNCYIAIIDTLYD